MKEFRWNNFDEEFISSVVYSPLTKETYKPSRKTSDVDLLIPSMEMIAPYPTKDFVIQYRHEIEAILLKKHQDYIGKIYKKVARAKALNHRGMLEELSAKELGASLIGEYIAVLTDIGSGEHLYDERSLYEQPVVIDLVKSEIKTIDLDDFQKAAVNKLNDALIRKNETSGLLVMPTGSGKTRTATYFFLRDMISQGYQVIWLTHRHMLIDQTADAFYNLAPLIKTKNSKLKTFKMACISGEHSSIKATEKDDNVMILSVQSVVRSLDYLKDVLASKVIIVVDEAHHTAAESYYKIIKHIRKTRKNVKLLGLTATPVRGTERESRYLHEIFSNNVIYKIPMAELITKQVLSTPGFESIETDTDIGIQISLDESKLLKKYGEIPPTLADKIAHSNKRNQVIIDTYMQNKERYGKTLIFALNAYHCYILCQELQKRGIKCDYIYSGNKDNVSKINRFKENELDVLVNINILTEGSDVPDIQTVLLTRPTQSEVLLMQMIGRGMRGKYYGGTDTVNIVDFCDKWDTFNKWLNPEWVVDPISEAPRAKGSSKQEHITIPWDLIRDIYGGISYKGVGAPESTQALPVGWYSLLATEEQDYRMLVFEEQVEGFNKMESDQEDILANSKLSPSALMSKYFGGFEMPPSRKDMELFLYDWRNSGEFPHMFYLEERDKIDPTVIAATFREQNVGLGDLDARIRDIFEANKDLINSVYGEYEDYYDRIFDCLKNQKTTSSSIIVEIPVELIPYSLAPTYDLKELQQEVINEMFDGHYEGIESVEWTNKPYSSFYGKYYLGGKIRINSLLNSPDVDRELVKFVIYHELLHRDYWRHDKQFYSQEHKYPNYTEHNRFLDHGIKEFKFEW